MLSFCIFFDIFYIVLKILIFFIKTLGWLFVSSTFLLVYTLVNCFFLLFVLFFRFFNIFKFWKGLRFIFLGNTLFFLTIANRLLHAKKKQKFYFLFIKRFWNKQNTSSYLLFFFNLFFKKINGFTLMSFWYYSINKQYWLNIWMSEMPLKIWLTNHKFFNFEDHILFPNEYRQMAYFWQTPMPIKDRNLRPIYRLRKIFSEKITFMGNREALLVFISGFSLSEKLIEEFRARRLLQIEKLFLKNLLNTKKQSILETMRLFSFVKHTDFTNNYKQNCLQKELFQEFFDRLVYDISSKSKTLEIFFRKNIINNVTKHELFFLNNIPSEYNVNVTPYLFRDNFKSWSRYEKFFLHKHLKLQISQNMVLKESKIWYFSFSVKYQYLRFLRKLRVYLITLDMLLNENLNGWQLSKLESRYTTRTDYWEYNWPKQNKLLSCFSALNETHKYKNRYLKQENQDLFGRTVEEFVRFWKIKRNFKIYKLKKKNRKNRNWKKWQIFSDIYAFNNSDYKQLKGIPMISKVVQRNLYNSLITKHFLWFLHFKKRVFFGWIDHFFRSFSSVNFLKLRRILFLAENQEAFVQLIFRVSQKQRLASSLLETYSTFLENTRAQQTFASVIKEKKPKIHQNATQNWYTFAFFETFKATVAGTESNLQNIITVSKKEKIMRKFKQRYKKMPISLFIMTTTPLMARDFLVNLVHPNKKQNNKTKTVNAFSFVITPSVISFLPKKKVYTLQHYQSWNKCIQILNQKYSQKVQVGVRTQTNTAFNRMGKKAIKHSSFPFAGSSFFGHFGNLNFGETAFQFYNKINNPFFFRQFWKNFVKDQICLKTPSLNGHNTDSLTSLFLSANFSRGGDRPAERGKRDVNVALWRELEHRVFSSVETYFWDLHLTIKKSIGKDFNLQHDPLFNEITQAFLQDFAVWEMFYASKRSLILYNSHFLKYIPVFFHFCFSKFFLFSITHQKNEQRSFIASQINNIFQQFHYIWYENQVDNTLESEVKFETFFPQHVTVSKTINYPSNQGPHDALSDSLYFSFFRPAFSFFGLSWPVKWQIVSSLETNKTELTFISHWTFFDFLKKQYNILLNYTLKMLTTFYLLSTFIKGFLFLVFIYLFSFFVCTVEVVNTLKFLYHNFLFTTLSKIWDFFDIFLRELGSWRILSFKITAQDFFEFYANKQLSLDTYFQSFYFNNPVILFKDSLTYNTYIQHLLGLDFVTSYQLPMRSINTSYYSYNIGSKWVNNTNDTLTDLYIFIKQIIIFISLWLLNYNIYYVLLCFVGHLCKKLLNFQDYLNVQNFNQTRKVIAAKRLDFMQVYLLKISDFFFWNCLLFFKSFLILFFAVEIIIFKNFMYILYELNATKLQTWKNSQVTFIWDPLLNRIKSSVNLTWLQLYRSFVDFQKSWLQTLKSFENFYQFLIQNSMKITYFFFKMCQNSVNLFSLVLTRCYSFLNLYSIQFVTPFSKKKKDWENTFKNSQIYSFFLQFEKNIHFISYNVLNSTSFFTLFFFKSIKYILNYLFQLILSPILGFFNLIHEYADKKKTIIITNYAIFIKKRYSCLTARALKQQNLKKQKISQIVKKTICTESTGIRKPTNSPIQVLSLRVIDKCKLKFRINQLKMFNAKNVSVCENKRFSNFIFTQLSKNKNYFLQNGILKKKKRFFHILDNERVFDDLFPYLMTIYVLYPRYQTAARNLFDIRHLTKQPIFQQNWKLKISSKTSGTDNLNGAFSRIMNFAQRFKHFRRLNSKLYIERIKPKILFKNFKTLKTKKWGKLMRKHLNFDEIIFRQFPPFLFYPEKITPFVSQSSFFELAYKKKIHVSNHFNKINKRVQLERTKHVLLTNSFLKNSEEKRFYSDFFFLTKNKLTLSLFNKTFRRHWRMKGRTYKLNHSFDKTIQKIFKTNIFTLETPELMDDLGWFRKFFNFHTLAQAEQLKRLKQKRMRFGKKIIDNLVYNSLKKNNKNLIPFKKILINNNTFVKKFKKMAPSKFYNGYHPHYQFFETAENKLWLVSRFKKITKFKPTKLILEKIKSSKNYCSFYQKRKMFEKYASYLRNSKLAGDSILVYSNVTRRIYSAELKNELSKQIQTQVFKPAFYLKSSQNYTPNSSSFSFAEHTIFSH